MRQPLRIAKPDKRVGGAHELAIDEKFPARANVRYPICGNDKGNGYGEEA
jgi:hypothetical protein